MSSGNTALSLNNEAFLLVGGTPIRSFNDSMKEATLANSFFERVRREVLRAYPWGCCTEKVVLSPLSQSFVDVSIYKNKFPLPLDCLRVITINEDMHGETVGNHAIEGRFIASNAGSIRLKYTRDETNISKYDASLVSALIYRLAQEYAFPLSQNQNMVSLYKTLYDEEVALARSHNAFEQSLPNEYGDNHLEQSRW